MVNWLSKFRVLTNLTNNLGSFDYHNWHPNIRATCHVTSDIISL
jgi:hypothetical protein